MRDCQMQCRDCSRRAYCDTYKAICKLARECYIQANNEVKGNAMVFVMWSMEDCPEFKPVTK